MSVSYSAVIKVENERGEPLVGTIVIRSCWPSNAYVTLDLGEARVRVLAVDLIEAAQRCSGGRT